jgi:hypothetical protein
VDTYYEYLRTFSQELGARIVEMYPPLQGPNDTLPASLMTLLRQPLPAQVLTISGVAKHLTTARSAIIVGECGTGKTLMFSGRLILFVSFAGTALSGLCHASRRIDCEK